jgi:nitrate/nitrite transport system permease protein
MPHDADLATALGQGEPETVAALIAKLGWLKKVTTIVIPSALPLIFTGLRLSLGVGWMVLIAAEMLAQIVVAVFTIGGIGFVLDRTMMLLQRSVSVDSATVR